MTIYYLIVGDKIKQEIDTEDHAVVAMPLLGGKTSMSLINRAHVVALINAANVTAAQAINLLGLVDERDQE